MKEAAGFPGVDWDKRHEAGKALGCSADVGEFCSCGRVVAEKLPSDAKFHTSRAVGTLACASLWFGT